MNETLQVALKEWAVICQALAEGRQILLLRKGGLAEPQGRFRVEHQRFWLLPTYVHQQETGIIPEYHDLLSRVRAEQPSPGQVWLSHVAEVAVVAYCHTLEQAHSLDGMHGWSPTTVEARFHYRQPGLFVLAVRVYAVKQPIQLELTPHLEGCKSWVVLDQPLPLGPMFPILTGENFTARCRPLERLPREV